MSKNRLIFDIGERVLWTFVQGATSTLLLTGFLEVEAWKAAAVGGVAAVLALAKGFAASHVGSPASAATLPNSVTDVGTITGELTGQVVGAGGEVLGEVVAQAEGTTHETLETVRGLVAKSAAKKAAIAKRVVKPRKKAT